MAQYYPKSQIQPNLYTNGDEYFLINTQTPYIGYYYKLSTNRKYTGKTPDSAGGVELIPNTTLRGNPQDLFPSPPNPIFTTENLSDFNEELLYYNNDLTIIYPKLPEFQERSLPQPHFPLPTIKDKEVGEYRRYFAKKTNELIYIEISKSTYDKFQNNDPQVASDLYEVAFLPWSLLTSQVGGNSSNKINRNIVSLTERELKWYGFSSYFKGNFGFSDPNLDN